MKQKKKLQRPWITCSWADGHWMLPQWYKSMLRTKLFALETSRTGWRSLRFSHRETQKRTGKKRTRHLIVWTRFCQVMTCQEWGFSNIFWEARDTQISWLWESFYQRDRFWKWQRGQADLICEHRFVGVSSWHHTASLHKHNHTHGYLHSVYQPPPINYRLDKSFG